MTSNQTKKYLFNYFLILFVSLIAMVVIPQRAYAASNSDIEAVRNLLVTALENGDSSAIDILQYNISYTECNNIIKDIKSNNAALYYSYDYNLYPSLSLGRNYVVKAVSFENMSSDAAEIRPLLEAAFNEIKSGIDPSMTQLDKLIYFHDVLVDKVVYKNDGTIRCRSANGALVNNKAVCMGYSFALMMLLQSENIPCEYVSGSHVNHGWVYVNIDGAWYHVDPTWDDTRKSRADLNRHIFLLRNDNEFASDGNHGENKWYVNNITEKSTSERFTNWFVHDIKGAMKYYNGYWYYVDNSNNIMKSKSDGTDSQVVVDGTGMSTIILVEINSEALKYKCNGAKIDFPLIPFIVEESFDEEPNPSSDIKVSEFEFKTDEKEETNNENVTFWNNLSDWRIGDYNFRTGKYSSSSIHRICLNDYIVCLPNTQYTVEITCDNNILVRELNSNYDFICSHNLSQGESFTPSVDCQFLGISMYNKKNDSSYYFSDYERIFSEPTFHVGLKRESIINEVETPVLSIENPIQETFSSNKSGETDNTNAVGEYVAPSPVEENSIEPEASGEEFIESSIISPAPSIEYYSQTWNSINQWRVGDYSRRTGQYSTSTSSRICLNDYLECMPSQTYTVTLSDTSLRVVIRQLDSEYQLISSDNMTNNASFTTASTCKYLGIGLYNPSVGEDFTYSDFCSLFESGSLSVGLSSEIVTYIYDETSPLGSSIIKKHSFEIFMFISIISLIIICCFLEYRKKHCSREV